MEVDANRIQWQIECLKKGKGVVIANSRLLTWVPEWSDVIDYDTEQIRSEAGNQEFYFAGPQIRSPTGHPGVQVEMEIWV